MPFDVPFYIGDGAVHDQHVLRNMAYQALGGREGVAAPKDLQVRPLAAPGPKVRIAPGSAAVLHRGTGILEETYTGRLPVEEQLDIASTLSGSGRSDLIVARIEDPTAGENSGAWATPVDPAAGPYMYLRVISNVANTVTTAAELGLDNSMIALARIDLPPTTTNITAGMIVDLRTLHTPLREGFVGVMPVGTTETLTASAATWEDKPAAATLTVNVPSWATHVRALGRLEGVKAGNGGSVDTTTGAARLKLSTTSDPTPVVFGTTTWSTDDATGFERLAMPYGADLVAVPASMRGKVCTLRVQVSRTAGTAAVTFAVGQTATVQGEFFQRPESNG